MKLETELEEILGEQKSPTDQSEERQKIDAVISAHADKIGASSVHVTLGKNATAASLEKTLTGLHEKSMIYDSFSDLEKEKARSARLRARIKKIYQLGKTDAYETQSKEISDLKMKIFDLADYFIDVDLDHDIEYMELAKENSVLARQKSYEIFEGNE